ncbi:MAG: DNA recombination protein RmuC [Verrucomicrobiota bacterium]
MEILFLIIGVVLGVVIGWLIGSRRTTQTNSPVEAELRALLANREQELAASRKAAADIGALEAAARTARDNALAQLEQAQDQLQTANTTAGELREQLAKRVAELAATQANLAAAHKLAEAQRLNQEQQMNTAREAQAKALADLRETFKALSADALKQSAPEFLRLANETFGKFQEVAKGDLATRQESIATLLKPLEEQLKTYQQRLQQSETAQSTTLGEVRKQLETLTKQSETLATETQQFRMVLKSAPARGRWGEETLRRVVEAAGMSHHCDFVEQAQSDDKKPDMIVHLPGNRVIIIDAKVPDLDFLVALDEADPAKRNEKLAAHAARLKDTIRALDKKDYPGQFPNALDYVVLFLPAESLFSAALEGDRDLIVWAAENRIMLATPASLIALLRSVSMSWQQSAQTDNARQIAEAAQELFARVAKFTDHLEKIRSGLARANEAFNDAVGSYERSVRPSGERVIKLGAGVPGKNLAELPPLDATLRLPPVGQ